MIKKIPFDHNGGPLWIRVEMTGLYFIKYQYQLWSNDDSQEPVLTKIPKQGNNEVPNDDFYQVVNEYAPTEAVARYVKRQIEVSFWIYKLQGDDGFNLRVKLLQGPSYQTATVLGETSETGTLADVQGNNLIHIIELL